MDTAVAGDRAGGGAPGARQASPMVSRLIVGMALRRLREASGFSREDAGQAIRAPVSKISRLEVGGTVARLREVAGLCAFYGVTDQAELAMLLGLARPLGQ